MKQKFKFTDTNGKVTYIEKTIRDIDHFNAQKNYKAHTFIDRKKRAKSGYQKYKGSLAY